MEGVTGNKKAKRSHEICDRQGSREIRLQPTRQGACGKAGCVGWEMKESGNAVNTLSTSVYGVVRSVTADVKAVISGETANSNSASSPGISTAVL